MKINPSAGLEQYQKYTKPVKNGTAANAAGKAAPRSDTVSFSDDAVARAEAGRVAGGIAAEVESAASPERLEELRAAVENGTYNVPAGDVADAILDMKV